MIDPRTKEVRTIAVQGAPTGIAVADGSAVVADGAAHKLTAFDATTGTLTYPAPLRGPSNGTLQIAGGPGGIWFADAAGGIVGKIDNTLTVGSPSRQLPVPPDSKSFASAYFSFAGLAIGERAIWVAGDARGRTVWRLDLRTGRVAATIPLRFVPGAIAAGEGAVWVTSLLDDTVSRIDPASNRITATIHAGRGIAGIAAGEGADLGRELVRWYGLADRSADQQGRGDPPCRRNTGTGRCRPERDLAHDPDTAFAGAC